ncbi:MAG TPA: DnaJ domain-containing protein [Bdellovibrionales bacterium]|nr:DnaJ domain-containing protein [Bdellovibrionales bacterium]
MGLGLLNELYFAFKRSEAETQLKSTTEPTRAKFAPIGPFEPPHDDSQERHAPDSETAAEAEGEARVELPPPNPAQAQALEFFYRHGTGRPRSSRELKKAYRRLARVFHPDSHPNVNDRERALLAVKFRQLRQAYETLAGYVTPCEARPEQKARA